MYMTEIRSVGAKGWAAGDRRRQQGVIAKEQWETSEVIHLLEVQCFVCGDSFTGASK